MLASYFDLNVPIIFCMNWTNNVEGEEDAKKKEVEKSKDEDVKGDTYAKENIEAAKTHLKESDSLLRDLVGNFGKFWHFSRWVIIVQ